MRAFRELALFALIAACDHASTNTTTTAPSSPSATVAASASVTPSASASADHCAMDAARLADVRAKVKTLKPGMSHADIDAVLGLDWKCFGGGGTGGPDNFTTGSVIAPGVQINLAWERKGDAGLLLKAASITP
jgi:hypothetical protein